MNPESEEGRVASGSEGVEIPLDPHARDFDLELVSAILVEAGAIDEDSRREVLVRARTQRGRLQKERGGLLSTRGHYEVSPIELVASLQLPDGTGREEVLDEDRITLLVAERIGVESQKIDPLKLDAQLITSTVSRAYARRHGCLPIGQRAGELLLAVVNPWDRELLENVRHITGTEVRPVLCSKADILRSITDVHGFRKSVTAAMSESSGATVLPDIGNLEQLVQLSDHEALEANDRPVVNAVEYLLHYAFDQRASDIHIEPRREFTQVRMRIDGVLHDIYRIPRALHAPVSSRVKVLARLDVAEKRRPQDGRIKTGRGDREVELRVSTVPVAFGEKVVIRVFDPEVLLQDLEDLGFYADELEQFERWISRPNGLILVTGPTGAGKTTTLYSSLQAINRPDINVVTIEDPVEMVCEAFNQISVQRGIGLDFSKALRHVLRQDPDVIMVGEIRDTETAQHAVQAALTGHLVLSTLHTNDSAGAVVRLRDLGVPPFLLGGTLIGSMAQRLVRRVCRGCVQEVPLNHEQLAALGVAHPEDHVGRVVAREGKGCPKCRGTGYLGRSGVFELFEMTPKIGIAVAEGADARTLREIARADGMQDLREHVIRKLADGVTSFSEVLRVTVES
ncbi:MAG: ATPase, T2SS/T4P/T4SS family [Deltaproteobacteria bacterium]|nr:ATPase, T2SS/T4P/T4SS family [Deltaproteobacteria bacterium]